MPRRCWCRCCPRTASRCRPGWPGCAAGRSTIRVPSRGDKRALMETVERNAGQSFTLHKLRRAGDLSARSRALAEIQAALDLPEAPLRIECFDISNLQGTNVVASMVVFEDGLARKAEYRRFAVRTVDGQDDVAAMHEVIRRRFAPLLAERDAAMGPPRRGDGRPTGRPSSPTRPTSSSSTAGRRRSPRPRGRWTELGITDVELCGLAKRLEEVWLPGREEPGRSCRGPARASTCCSGCATRRTGSRSRYHRQKRSQSMTTSALDAVPGLGETRRKALLQAVRLGEAAARGDAPRRSRRCPASGRSTARRRSRDRAGGAHRAGAEPSTRRPARSWNGDVGCPT